MLLELILISLIAAFTARILYVLVLAKNRNTFDKLHARTLIVIGSGGHTSEMTKQISKLNPKLYQPRLYVLADSDSSSVGKIEVLESNFNRLRETEFRIKTIPRSRHVESICRVHTLSLSGKILLPIADKVLVQWPQLKLKYPKTDFIGKLI